MKGTIIRHVFTSPCRPSFAANLSQATCVLCRIRTLLDHGDIRTTMHDTHCVPGPTVMTAKSPLIFNPSEVGCQGHERTD